MYTVYVFHMQLTTSVVFAVAIIAADVVISTGAGFVTKGVNDVVWAYC